MHLLLPLITFLGVGGSVGVVGVGEREEAFTGGEVGVGGCGGVLGGVHGLFSGIFVC